MIKEKYITNSVETVLIDDVENLTNMEIMKKKIQAIISIIFSSNYILHYRKKDSDRVKTLSLNCNKEMIKTNRNSLDYLEHSVNLNSKLSKIFN